MALVCDVKSVEETQPENPDLEDGEIEDDDDEEISQQPEPIAQTQQAAIDQILPAPIPTDTNIFKQNDAHPGKKRKHSTERKSDKHLTEAEKSVRYLHKLERAERERRERLRKETLSGNTDDWAGNVEKAIASVLKKEQLTASAGEEPEEEEKKRGRKRKKKDRNRAKKHRKTESPKQEDVDEDEMLLIRGGSPENKVQKEASPLEGEGYESYDSEYDSEYEHFGNRPNKRKFDREHKNRRNREGTKRERKNFKEKQREKRNEQNRPQMQDGSSICMFYMQGKCHKGEECPYSHDALPPLKMELCKFYLMDCCAKRDKCLYMHSEFPCKFYHTGLKCFAKDNCKFAHGKSLNDSLKQILLKHLETAPKEILGDFPRLSREGAHNLVNQTQKMLEGQYGVKNGAPAQTEKSNIPSLFDITIPMPLELMNQNAQQQNNAQNNMNEEPKPKLDKPEKKVRQTRWNDDPPVPVLNPSTFVNPVFNSLTLQDQQKLQEYQMNFQLKGFYSEQDQDMRINSNGDVDMRSLPLLQPKTDSPKQLKTDLSEAAAKMDVDIRNHADSRLGTSNEVANINNTYKTDKLHDISKKEHEASDSSINMESNLTIDEKSGDSGCDLPSSLPKKQRELFLRIQAQQKENLLENQKQDDDEPSMKDEDWYSSDEDNDPLSKMVIHLEDEPKEEKSPERILSPPTIKPVEVIDKLGDLSKIDISAEVTKLLTSIKSNNQILPSATPATTSEIKNPRDPRQAHSIVTESAPTPVVNTDPRSKSGKVGKRESGSSIYEQGYINSDHKISIYEQVKGDIDLRNLDGLTKDLDMRSVSPFGDTDLRPGGRQDVDLRQLNLPFKAIQNYTPASEIDASIRSHNPITYRVHIIDIPRPDYSGLKLNAQDAQVNSDPRLRKIFRVPSTEEKDSPASPSNQPHASPPKAARQDPRRRNAPKSEESQKDTPAAPMTYSQQLQLLQNSAFYQSLTSNQKLMLNQEIASKGDQNTSNDPILTGILSNIGLITSGTQNNGCAANILANVNSLVPNMNNLNPNMNQMSQGLGPMNQGMMPPNVGPNMGQGLGPMGPGMLPLGSANVQNPNMMNQPNMGPGMGGPGLLGAAPGVPVMPNMGQNDFQINFDPRNGGLLGPAPFQNFPDNQNFGQFNDDFYPDNNDGNFGGGGGNFNNPRNDRNFRNDRNQPNNNRRGRSWNNRHNNNRNYNRNNRNRSNRSYTPP